MNVIRTIIFFHYNLKNLFYTFTVTFTDAFYSNLKHSIFAPILFIVHLLCMSFACFLFPWNAETTGAHIITGTRGLSTSSQPCTRSGTLTGAGVVQDSPCMMCNLALSSRKTLHLLSGIPAGPGLLFCWPSYVVMGRRAMSQENFAQFKGTSWSPEAVVLGQARQWQMRAI